MKVANTTKNRGGIMKTIMIVCSGGNTSGLLATKVAKESEKEGIKTGHVWMYDMNSKENMDEVLKDRDLLIIYGAAQHVTKELLDSYGKKSLNVEFVFLAPQMRHLAEILKKECSHIKFEGINFQDFGLMRGDLIFRRIKEALDL